MRGAPLRSAAYWWIDRDEVAKQGKEDGKLGENTGPAQSRGTFRSRYLALDRSSVRG